MVSREEIDKLILYLEFIQNKVVDLQEIKNEYYTPENQSKSSVQANRENVNKDKDSRVVSSKTATVKSEMPLVPAAKTSVIA